MDPRDPTGTAHARPFPVDPDTAHAHLLRRDVVVEDALGDVQDLVLFHARVLLRVAQQVLEVAQVGLVATDVLGGVDAEEVDAGQRSGEGLAETLPVDVAHRDEFVVLGQPPAGVHGVRESRPRADAVAEPPGLSVEVPVLDAEGGTQAEVRLAQDLAVPHRGVFGLHLRLDLVEFLGELDPAFAGPAVAACRKGRFGRDARHQWL